MPQTASAIDPGFLDFDSSPIFTDLCSTEKCHLLSLLATWQQQVLDDQPFSLEDAVAESLYELTPEVSDYLDFLIEMGSNHATARRFMWGLAQDIKDDEDLL